MIYFIYLLLAALVVFLSIKAAVYVDLIDKKTDISGAFIGGVLLSAVTSLPELLTTLSSTVWLKNPSLSLGNILGSNLFNMTIVAVLIIFGIKAFGKAKISKSHTKTTSFGLVIYLVILLNMMNIINFDILTISITSIVILILYVIAVKSMAGEEESAEKDEDETAVTSNLTMKQIITRFIAVSIGLVLASILITYVTDIIAVRLNLGAGLAGALLLGIATSLPELTSCISLVKIGNFNVSIGNVVGSNLFNFFILFIADITYFRGTVYNFADSQNKNLIFFGILSSILVLLILNIKDKVSKNYVYITLSLGIIMSYLGFMIV